MIQLPEYKLLIDNARKAATLASCSTLLSWDQQTYMPPNGGGHRSEQLTLLAGMVHELETAPEIGEWLSICENSSLTNSSDSFEGANIREWRHSYNRHIKVPKRLIEELTLARSNAFPAWVEARKKSDFKLLKPYLEEIVRLTREYADAIGYNQNRYDALIDGYEPGIKTSDVRFLFNELRNDLLPLINKAMNSHKQPDQGIFTRNFQIDLQRVFAEMLVAKIGFDFNGGRLDTVPHPFSTQIGPGDLRITTRWNEQNIESGLFSAMHEVGHALYNQGLPKEAWGTPAGSACSLSVHESQARLWENFIGRSLPFWQYFFPLLKAFFPRVLNDVVLESFVHALNRVNFSYLRIGSDEGTYNFHIILRFELEVSMITGELEVVDLPEAWNTMFKKIFNLQVPDDARGCLQDAHWSDGDFGYFPTYTLGNIYAAQFISYVRKCYPNIDDDLSRGNFLPLLSWLNENIYRLGSLYRSGELVKKITGEPLNYKYLINLLHSKYSDLYGI